MTDLSPAAERLMDFLTAHFYVRNAEDRDAVRDFLPPVIAEARAPLEAQVAELRAALEWVTEPAGVRHGGGTIHVRPYHAGSEALGCLICAALTITADPSARVALRWLRSQERLAAALHHYDCDDPDLRNVAWGDLSSRDLALGRNITVGLDQSIHRAQAAAIVAAMEEET